MMAGYVKMQRDWQAHDLFDGDEFSRRDAWAWLICQAAWKPKTVRVAGKRVDLERGELCFSIRFLAEKWGWSKSRVARFIDDLRAESMIETRLSSGTVAGQLPGQRAGQSQTVLTICNYKHFQASDDMERDSMRDSLPKKAGQSRDKEEERKEKKNIKRALPDGWKPEPFKPETEAAKIAAGWSAATLASQLEKFGDYHRAKGNSFSDWQAAWGTWVRNSVAFQPRAAARDEGNDYYWLRNRVGGAR